MRFAKLLILLTIIPITAIANTITVVDQISANSDALAFMIAANLAKQNNDKLSAIEYSTKAALLAKSPEYAKFATELSVEAENFKLAENALDAWIAVDSNNVEPLMLQFTLLMEPEPNKASQNLYRAININEFLVCEQLADLQSQLHPSQQDMLLKVVDLVIAKNEKLLPLRDYIVAEGQILFDRINDANRTVSKSLEAHPDFTANVILKSKIINHLKSPKDAIAFLKKESNRFPKNYDLAIFYANVLFDYESPKESLSVLENLIKSKSPYQSRAHIMTAKIYFEQKNYKLAKVNLQEASKDPKMQSVASMYLGKILLNEGNIDEAYNVFSQIPQGEFKVEATVMAADIMNKQGKYEDALHLLKDLSPNNFAEQQAVIITQIDTLVGLNEIEIAKELIEHALTWSKPQSPFFNKLMKTLEEIKEAKQ